MASLIPFFSGVGFMVGYYFFSTPEPTPPNPLLKDIQNFNKKKLKKVPRRIETNELKLAIQKRRHKMGYDKV